MYQKRRKKINVYNALTVAKSHRAIIIMEMMMTTIYNHAVKKKMTTMAANRYHYAKSRGHLLASSSPSNSL